MFLTHDHPLKDAGNYSGEVITIRIDGVAPFNVAADTPMLALQKDNKPENKPAKELTLEDKLIQHDIHCGENEIGIPRQVREVIVSNVENVKQYATENNGVNYVYGVVFDLPKTLVLKESPKPSEPEPPKPSELEPPKPPEKVEEPKPPEEPIQDNDEKAEATDAAEEQPTEESEADDGTKDKPNKKRKK